MNYISVAEAALKWNITSRRIRQYCSEGRIPGVIRKGRFWLLPENAMRPKDGRSSINENFPAVDPEASEAVLPASLSAVDAPPNQPVTAETETGGNHVDKTRGLLRHFPLLVMSFASLHPEFLSEDEKCLLKLQELYLGGDFPGALDMAQELLASSDEPVVYLGCLTVVCICSMYHGDLQTYNATLEQIRAFVPAARSDEMQQDLLIYQIESAMANFSACPDWLRTGKLTGLPAEAVAFARMLYLHTNIFSPLIFSGRELSAFEFISCEGDYNNRDAAAIYEHMTMAILYRNQQMREDMQRHLKTALTIALRHRWYAPLAERLRPLGSVVLKMLHEMDPSAEEKVLEINSRLLSGWNIIYQGKYNLQPTFVLTLREREIVDYVLAGRSNKDIAAVLNVSVETVKKYLQIIYQKTNCSNRKELSSYISINQ